MNVDKDCFDDAAKEVRNDSVDSDHQEPHEGAEVEGGNNSGGLCGSDSNRPDVATQIEIEAADAETRGQRKTDDELDQSTKSEVSTTIDLAASRSRRFSGRLRDKMSNSVLPRREEAGDGEMEDVESNRPAQVNRASRLSSTESSSSGVDMSENRTGQTPSSARRRSSRSYEKRLKDKISNSISLRRVEPGDGEMEDIESNRSSLFSDSPAQVNRASRLSSTESSSGLDMSGSRTGQTPLSARRQSSRRSR